MFWKTSGQKKALNNGLTNDTQHKPDSFLSQVGSFCTFLFLSALRFIEFGQITVSVITNHPIRYAGCDFTWAVLPVAAILTFVSPRWAFIGYEIGKTIISLTQACAPILAFILDCVECVLPETHVEITASSWQYLAIKLFKPTKLKVAKILTLLAFIYSQRHRIKYYFIKNMKLPKEFSTHRLILNYVYKFVYYLQYGVEDLKDKFMLGYNTVYERIKIMEDFNFDFDNLKDNRPGNLGNLRREEYWDRESMNVNVHTHSFCDKVYVPNPFRYGFSGCDSLGNIVFTRRVRYFGDTEYKVENDFAINRDLIYTLVSYINRNDDEFTNYTRLRNLLKTPVLQNPAGTEDVTIWYAFYIYYREVVHERWEFQGFHRRAN
jgi:hypothetical protein